MHDQITVAQRKLAGVCGKCSEDNIKWSYGTLVTEELTLKLNLCNDCGIELLRKIHCCSSKEQAVNLLIIDDYVK